MDELIKRRRANLAKAKRFNGLVCLDVCGGITPFHPEYNNIDIDTGDFLVDLLKGIPFPDCSVDHLVSIATLEHFKYEEFLFVLAEMVRVLKIGGRISISTPDVEKIARIIVEKGFHANFHLVNENLYALQRDQYDIHKVALSGPFVLSLLRESGFGSCIEDDIEFHIRHNVDTSSRISAIKEKIVEKTDWLSKYRAADGVLPLAKSDCVRISAKLPFVRLFLPSSLKLLSQVVSVSIFGKKLPQTAVKVDDATEIKLPALAEDMIYVDLVFEFSHSIKPADIGVNEDVREIGAFLVW